MLDLFKAFAVADGPRMADAILAFSGGQASASMRGCHHIGACKQVQGPCAILWMYGVHCHDVTLIRRSTKDEKACMQLF